MRYEHIRGLTPEDLALADSEIPSLARVIDDYRIHIPTEAWSVFEAQVAREWSIETGQIEGLYKFDRGLTVTLIEDGITASRIPPTSSDKTPEQVAAILNDHLATLEGLFSFVKGERDFSKSYIHELHQQLLRSVTTYNVYVASENRFEDRELVKGKYKSQPNNPTRPDGSILEFCPPEQVEAEMDQLVSLFREQEAADVPADILAAWLHHAFTHIHPYPDGNGRVARALATLVLIKRGLLPLVVPSAEKQSVYIPALEQADEHQYPSLVTAIRLWQDRLVVELSQKVEFGDTRTASNLDEFYDAVKHDLYRRGLQAPETWAAVNALERELLGRAKERFNEVLEKLATIMQTVKVGGFSLGRTGAGDKQAQALLSSIGLSAALESGLVFTLGGKVPATISLLIGRAGEKQRGLKVAGFWFVRGGLSENLGHPFLINFAEVSVKAHERFDKWLEPLLLQGLERWREANLLE